MTDQREGELGVDAVWLTLGKTLRDCGLTASMGRRGDADDNAACESFISTIKNELIPRRTSARGEGHRTAAPLE